MHLLHGTIDHQPIGRAAGAGKRQEHVVPDDTLSPTDEAVLVSLGWTIPGAVVGFAQHARISLRTRR